MKCEGNLGKLQLTLLTTTALLYFASALITGYAPDLVILIIGRLIYGIGIGMAMMHGAPLYIAETSPSEIRGTLIYLKELFIFLGILLGYLVKSLEINTVGSGATCIVVVISVIGMLLLPCSLRWLLLRAVQGKGPMEEYKRRWRLMPCKS
ncbi:D-xylose-proton symporter-like 3 [Carex littledalei]|uniref:D-xylose-proton symporter-like 3 n=1 Tax=Carex littledalei TaxID=544730 RepID=A0A833QLG0_9POAL|nr:D-xylose-proton symporter-like 3 [Carex littledalei]